MAPSPFLLVSEVAAALKVKPGTVYLWISQRRLAVVRIGRLVRIPVSELTRLIDAGTEGARPESEGRSPILPLAAARTRLTLGKLGRMR